MGSGNPERRERERTTSKRAAFTRLAEVHGENASTNLFRKKYPRTTLDKCRQLGVHHIGVTANLNRFRIHGIAAVPGQQGSCSVWHFERRSSCCRGSLIWMVARFYRRNRILKLVTPVYSWPGGFTCRTASRVLW
jgi:hypothetical protein